MSNSNTKMKLVNGSDTGGGTLASSVYDHLRNDILQGKLRPGEKLRAEFLRERYKVGNTPAREALNRLSAEGLVCREDQKGFHVATVSKSELLELNKTRCWLEEIALRESIRRGDSEWEEKLVLANHRLMRTPHASESGADLDMPHLRNLEWEHLHREFHRSLTSACGSKWLQGFCDQLMMQADRYRQLAFTASFPKRNEQKEHQDIIDACIERNADKAVELLQGHYNQTADIILSSDPSLLENANRAS